jgi:predicted transcriptional regulator
LVYTDLIDDISQIYVILNGRTIDGRNASYGSLFKTTRYAVILLAAITIETFKDHTLEIKGTYFYNLYRLEKVADALHLEYDRTKQAKKIYADMEGRQEVMKKVTKDNRTYISLTKKGIEKCLKKIQELHKLKDYFARFPPVQENYTEDLLTDSSRPNLRSKSQEMNEFETEVEKLIQSISVWV